MRLWHIDLIHYLPKSQLLAQWRELNSIYKKQDKHILINYIYDYPKAYLMRYSQEVINEMLLRGIKVKTFDNYNEYFKNVFSDNSISLDKAIYKEHNKEYLTICYYNLREKYLRGQKDFDDACFSNLQWFYYEQMKG